MTALPLSRRRLLLAVLGVISLGEQMLGLHYTSLPMIRLGPALMLAGLMLAAPGERAAFAALALAVDMLATALTPHGTMAAMGIALHGICTLGGALAAAWCLHRRATDLATPHLRGLLDLSLAAMMMAAPLGLAEAALVHEQPAVASAHLLFGHIGPVVLGVITLVPLLMMPPQGAARPLRLLVPAALVVVSFVWPTPVLAVLMPVVMVLVTLGLTLRETLLSVVLAAIAGTCTAAMSGHGMMPALVPEALDAIRARWLSWMAAQITLSTAMSAARHAAAQTTALQTMLRAVPEVAFRADSEGRWQWASPGWSALTGRAPEIGEPMADLFTPNGQPALTRALARTAMPGASATRLRLMLAREQGSPCEVEISLAALGEGGVAGIMRDVSESGAALKAAQEASAGWHELCDAAPVGIVRCDAQGIVTYANWAAELMALGAQTRVPGHPLRDWLADDPAFDIALLELRLTMPGAQTGHELKIGRLWLSVVETAKFDAGGRRDGYVVAVTDITAR